MGGGEGVLLEGAGAAPLPAAVPPHHPDNPTSPPHTSNPDTHPHPHDGRAKVDSLKMEAFIDSFVEGLGLDSGYTLIVVNPKWSSNLQVWGGALCGGLVG